MKYFAVIMYNGEEHCSLHMQPPPKTVDQRKVEYVYVSPVAGDKTLDQCIGLYNAGNSDSISKNGSI